MLKHWRRIGRRDDGVALIEFAIVFPLLMILVLLCVEFSRYFLIHMKVQNAAYAMGNILTQYPAPSATPAASGELDQDQIISVLGANQLQKLLSPYANSNNVSMVVSSLRKEVSTYSQKGLVVKWQICSTGLSGCSTTSIVTQASVPGAAAFVKNTPANFIAPYNSSITSMAEGENTLVVEIYYQYAPLYTQLFMNLGAAFSSYSFPGISPQIIRHVAFFVPRSGNLICLPPSATGSPNTYFSYNDGANGGCPCSTATYDAGCGSLPQ